MRAFTILVAALLSAGALTGCLGNAAEKEPEPEEVGTAGLGTNLGSTTTGGTAAAAVKVLAPLTSTVKLTADAWVAPGTSIPVEAAAPANAKGAVTYTWAVGALPGTTEVKALNLDTKTIEVGGSKVLTFTTAGVYRLHCHPHPAMKHNVTVVDGLAPSDVTVDIIDGDKPSEYRFVPENVIVGVGSKVTYANKGALVHTATQEAQEAPLKKVALEAAKGEIKLDGNGWQRVVVLMRDAEGRVGQAEQRIYVAPLPTFAGHAFPFSFNVGGLPAEAETAEPPKTSSFVLEQTLKANISVVASVSPGGQALPAGGDSAQVEVHITPQGETQDAVTCDAAATCEQLATLPKGTYTIKVIAKQGAAITGEVKVLGTYEAIPPEPTMKAAAAEGGHGGHAH